MPEVIFALIVVTVAVAVILTVGVLAMGGALFLQWLADWIMERWWES